MDFNAKINEKINNQTLNKTSSYMATILKINTNYNVATIFIPFYGKQRDGRIFKNVPITIGSNGVHQSSLRVNDTVYVTFNDTSSFSPKILGKADELYNSNTREKEKHLNKGALIIQEKNKIDSEEEYIGSFQDWVNQNTDNDFINLQYKDKDPLVEIYETQDEFGYFSGGDVGMYNPKTSSIVKLKDDGDIDIFVNDDIGIRVNNKNKKIEIYGSIELISKEILLNGEKIYGEN